MTPSLIGRMATMLPGVRPSIRRASSPTARTLRLWVATATTEGSRSTIPLPFTYTRMLAVPRSTPMTGIRLSNFISPGHSIAGAPDVRTQTLQLVDHVFVAAIQVIQIADNGLALRRQTGGHD